MLILCLLGMALVMGSFRYEETLNPGGVGGSAAGLHVLLRGGWAADAA